ncbi:periplasmic serine endoprotease [Vibrio crassostreae]|uniref:Do family serine endopeptidase n=1 Tax=Vibrio crassostreae TaxID=246167 RepID=UPI00070C72F9|nr:Do family serine endopeptidase [Vibrio crassostreae]TCT60085.1 serine protease Do/serine protease DegQ [Vibrio crassostreae]TCT74598.1 serine protease Do/serine protease DegQ [Vibrio crassostreae]TCT81774.1 serine protease Do/serine protease DegQ [Vibrio crassostreae]TCU04135.1 serine protease Do/serine protease DegQ [Vibrio crassostreae]TDW07954.1 serine protease Do/serine protease DegQ [Vibrio crassostreae]
MKKPLLALSVLTLSLSSIITPIQATAALPLSVGNEQLPSLAPMLEQVTPAVVSIAVEGKQVQRQQIPEQFQFFFGPEQTRERPFRGLGSGVIINAKKGHIVTNYHVINGADDIKVKLHDGREYDAELIGGDQMSDIALLKLEEAKNLTQIKVADSDKLRVGDFSVAIGNPFGLGQTVTSGIVSALGRSGLNLENFENFIQTDAAINSGNSGGALVNLNGELIGINTAILGPNGGNVGIGFAIPSNMMKNLTEQILDFGEVKRGMLGVQGGEITSELAEALGYESSKGAFVSQVVPDSAADDAGLKAGDIIVSINGKRIDTFSELRAKVATLGAGKEIELGVVRDGKNKTFDVTLGESTNNKTQAEKLHEGLAGAELTNTTDSDSVKGVKVSSVAQGSPAEAYQLLKDDIIIGVNRQTVKNLAEFREILEKQPGVLALNIQRGDRTIYLVIR